MRMRVRVKKKEEGGEGKETTPAEWVGRKRNGRIETGSCPVGVSFVAGV